MFSLILFFFPLWCNAPTVSNALTGKTLFRRSFRDFEDFEDEYGKLIDSKVTALLEAGFISNTHAGLPFSKRLAAVSHDCTDEVFQKYINPFLNDLDCMHARTKAFYNFISNQRVLDVVEGIVGEEILCNPIQHVRCYLPVRNGVQMSGNIASLAPQRQDG